MRRLLEYLANPPVWAVAAHRRAHRLWLRNHRLAALLVAAWARVLTGVDIHPGATIGRRLEIGHGVGLVIGASAEIGDDCELLHGVTLGRKHGVVLPDGRRHPRLGHRVEVGAHAVLLGPITVGDDAKIGAAAVVLNDVPARWTAVGNPARLLPPKAQRAPDGPAAVARDLAQE